MYISNEQKDTCLSKQVKRKPELAEEIRVLPKSNQILIFNIIGVLKAQILKLLENSVFGDYLVKIQNSVPVQTNLNFKTLYSVLVQLN